MITPRTKYSDYTALKQEKNELARRASEEHMTIEQFQAQMEMLEARYRDRVFQEDVNVFTNFQDFERFVMSSGFYWQMADSVEHERAHGEKAKELGYTVSYICAFLRDDISGGLIYQTSFKIKEILIRRGHFRQIAAAPERLSRTDRDHLDFIEGIKQ